MAAVPGTVSVDSRPSLVAQYDELVSATNVLCAGTEGVFGEFVSNQLELYRTMETVKAENCRLKAENASKEVLIKVSRNSFDELMKQREETEMTVKQYEKQFTIIRELLKTNDRMSMLNEAEKRSLEFLKDGRKRISISPGNLLADSCDTISPSDVSVEPADTDESVSFLRDGTKWKRRRTKSSDLAENTSLMKKQRAENGKAIPSSDENDPLVVNGEVNKVQPLERHFKKPPPTRNRRKPSKAHLHAVAISTSNPQLPPPPAYAPVELPCIPVEVPPIEMQYCEEPVPSPSAPPPPAEQVFETEDEEMQRLERQLFNSPTQPVCSEPYQQYGAPLESILSPRMYPELDDDGGETESTDGYCTPLGTPLGTPNMNVVQKTQSDINLTRRHVFFSKTMMKPVTCEVCNKKIGFGKNCLKCKNCRAVCHTECKEKVPLPCVPAVHTPKKKLKTSNLASFCPNSIPRVPALVVHCVKEIEQRGLTQVGIYHVPGSDKSVKELRERLLKAKGTPNLSKVEDINVVCGCLKDFLHSIREPVVTFRMHPAFMQAVEEGSDEKSLTGLLEAIAQLPPCNKDTLAFLILHLQRVSSYSDANKMPVSSLAKVFGPIIVGHGSETPQSSTMWKETQLQPKVIERLISISADYWRQYLSPEDNPDPSSPTPVSNFGSPATPEPRPIPESPFLGSVMSPRSRINTQSVSSLSTPSTSSISHTVRKPGGGFFAALN